MADSFFAFESEFKDPSNTLGKNKLEEDLLTDNVEEEYDALNDETFGLGADDGDWEEDHEKLSELIVKEKDVPRRSLFFDEPIFDGDENQHDIVTKSISQLGLEDDLDDPAIMTVGHTSHVARPLESIFRSSPPPPAILDSEFCGSPKTYSIWSTNHSSTPAKDSGVGSMLQSINHHSYRPSSSSLSTSPCDVFRSPLNSKAWTLEEIERDFLSSTKSQTTSDGDWSPAALYSLKTCQSTNNSSNVSSRIQGASSLSQRAAELQNKHFSEVSNSLSSVPMPVSGTVRTLDDVEKDILLKPRARTLDEVERHMQANMCAPNRHGDLGTPISAPKTRQSLLSPVGAPPGIRSVGPFHTPPGLMSMMGERASPNIAPGPNIMPFGIPRRLLLTPQSVTHPFNASPMMGSNLDCRLGGLHYRMPGSMINSPPGLDPRRMNIFQSRNMATLAYPRTVNHPLLQNSQNQQMSGHWTGYRGFDSDPYRRLDEHFDDYAGLMTQKEKEWLLRIQLMLLHFDNPYVEDFYYTTFISRKCAEEFSKTAQNGDDGPKLMLPERSKPETKVYVPTHFEGSLGKLQAVSVNFPRKVLDITVSRPLEDDEGRVVTCYQSLMKYRRLLLDIEKMYNYLLEIDDEEKRILALPDDMHESHLETIVKLSDKIASGLSCETVTVDDTFQNIMTIRKGRNLGLRSFKIMTRNQKLSFLVALFRCLTIILRKDQNDMVLLKNCNMITNFIKKLPLTDLVSLGESLENLPRVETVIVTVKEKSNFLSAFKSKFGSSIVCCMIQQAEDIYSNNDSCDSEMQARWAKVVLHMVDILCAVPDTSIVPPSAPCMHLLTHFQRFAVDRDKFEVLKKKVQIFQFEPVKSEDTPV